MIVAVMKHYQLTPVEANCPICYSRNAQLLWSVDSEQAARHYVSKEAEPQRFKKLADHISNLWQQKTCNVVRCDDCGFCYSYPYTAGDDKFYDLAYERSGYPTWKWEHQLTYDALKDKRNFTLLEIGAGDGAFIRRITPELTSQTNVLCTEYSNYGRGQIQQLGLNCLAVDIRSKQFEPFKEHFDVICMFQVLEHMDRLDDLFQRLNYLTRKQASLFISVPNPKCIEFSELNGGLLDMPPNHIGRWNREGFEKLGERWGWFVENHAIEENTFASKAELFLKYRFWREGQHPGTPANRISRIKNHNLSKLMTIGCIGLYTVSDLPKLSRLRAVDLGFSQWVHLKRKASLEPE
ncbi:MAG: class I SAM-dependent methyltransferase [Elainella sp. C42_A2020_010]|nr:class I SAM-dependent methyltransferase [Elainella sp. C42_A2020_010]